MFISFRDKIFKYILYPFSVTVLFGVLLAFMYIFAIIVFIYLMLMENNKTYVYITKGGGGGPLDNTFKNQVF